MKLIFFRRATLIVHYLYVILALTTTIAVVSSSNWKKDKRYDSEWLTGYFTYGLPTSSKCKQMTVFGHGRFICTTGKGLSRIMCIGECMREYEQLQRTMIYLCRNDGVWLNIIKTRVTTPYIICTPRHNISKKRQNITNKSTKRVKIRLLFNI